MATGIPIITCGDSEPDAIRVHAGMKPEYDVLYAAFLVPEARHELPLILTGKPPAKETLHTQIAANDFSRHPLAVVIGGGYSDEHYQKLHQACVEAAGDPKKLGVAFFRADNELTDRLVKEGKSPEKRTKGYAQAISERLRAKLKDVVGNGSLKEEDVGQLFLF